MTTRALDGITQRQALGVASHKCPLPTLRQLQRKKKAPFIRESLSNELTW